MLFKKLLFENPPDSSAQIPVTGGIFILACWIAVQPEQLFAASFDIDSGVLSTPQTLNDDETGTITSPGRLTVSGPGVVGVTVNGDRATINLNGQVGVSGDNSIVVLTNGADTQLNINSVIIATGTNGDIAGLSSLGANTVLNNNGNLLVVGDSGTGTGVFLQSNNASVINNAIIAGGSQNSEAYGLFLAAGATDSQLINNATLRAEGELYSVGVDVLSSNFSLTSNSLIIGESTSADGYGIRLRTGATNAQITNSGTIQTRGATFSNSVWIQAADASVMNSGMIDSQSTGGEAEGVYFDTGATNGSLLNTGTIAVTGDTNTYGVYLGANNTTVTNSGIISVNGSGAQTHGISVQIPAGSSVVINNSGMVSASGTNAFAIFSNNGGGDTTVNLQNGSQIQGPVQLGGSNDVINVFMGAGSLQFAISGVENVNFVNTAGAVVNGNVVVFDPTAVVSHNAVLNDVVIAINKVVVNRSIQLAQYQADLQPVQLASNELTPGLLWQQPLSSYWGQIFHGERKYAASAFNNAYAHDYTGFTLGYDQPLGEGYLGVFGGIVKGDAVTVSADINTADESYYLGGYYTRSFAEFDLLANLQGGYSKFDNRRRIAGTNEQANASFDAWFVSPSLRLSSAYALNDNFQLRPAGQLGYSHMRIGSYQETGSSSDFSFASRNVSNITAGLELGLAYQPALDQEYVLRLGRRHINSDNGQISGSLAGSVVDFSAVTDQSRNEDYLGLNFRFLNQTDLSLSFDLEVGQEDGRHAYTEGVFKLEYFFH